MLEIKQRIQPLKDHITDLVRQKIPSHNKHQMAWRETITGLAVVLIDAPKHWPITHGDVLGGIKEVQRSIQSSTRVGGKLQTMARYGFFTYDKGNYFLKIELPGELLGNQEA